MEVRSQKMLDDPTAWRGRKWRAVAILVLIGGVTVGPGAVSAQDPDTSFFVALEGPTWGADLPALEVSDQHCADLAYAAGLGEAEWRAYLTTDGETARERIGPGPFVNWYGAVVAEDPEQLHTDAGNLSRNTAATETGDGPISEEVLPIPPGSQLSGEAYSREGPFFCFKLP